MPNMTHWGLSISIGRASSSSSSGKTGASLSTVVNRLTVETVTRSRNAVSTSEHLLTGLQCRIEVPRGMRMAARAQSTMAWWKRRPWLHLRWKCFLLWLMMTVQQLTDCPHIWKTKAKKAKSRISESNSKLGCACCTHKGAPIKRNIVTGQSHTWVGQSSQLTQNPWFCLFPLCFSHMRTVC